LPISSLRSQAVSIIAKQKFKVPHITAFKNPENATKSKNGFAFKVTHKPQPPSF